MIPVPPATSAPAQKLRLLTPLNLGTIAVVVAWLVFACYAVAYLISH